MKILNLITLMSFMCLLNTAGAQSLPSIQQESMWAPTGMKVDGKLPEWPNLKLLANNSANRIQYAVTNDNDNLYLTILGGGANASRKVLTGGMIFTISHQTDKKNREKAKDNVVITYPIPLGEDKTDEIMETVNLLDAYVGDMQKNHVIIDSIVLAANNKASADVKEIKVSGINAITDTVISVYNEQSIKAAMKFIRRMPVIELAIPLKYLGLSVGDASKIAYNIRLNGDSSVLPPQMAANMDMVKMGPDMLYITSVTDLWGEYTLAKKP